MPDTVLHPTCMLSHFTNEEIETQKLNDLPRVPWLVSGRANSGTVFLNSVLYCLCVLKMFFLIII